MDIERAAKAERDARMAMVRGFRDQTLSDQDREALAAAHAYAKTRLRIVKALAEGPEKLTARQKREIAGLL